MATDWSYRDDVGRRRSRGGLGLDDCGDGLLLLVLGCIAAAGAGLSLPLILPFLNFLKQKNKREKLRDKGKA